MKRLPRLANFVICAMIVHGDECQMKHKFIRTIMVVLMTALLSCFAGCGGVTSEQLPTVSLSIWWSDEGDRELLNEKIDEFKEKYSDKAVFEITVSKESILTIRETVLAMPQKAADIYMFADDQFDILRGAGALLEITENTSEIISANGGEESGACRAAMHDGKLYGYPLTAGNGYFLYYNSKYFSEDDIKSLDRIIEVSEQNGKKMSIDYSSGWYIYSFFKGAGLELGLNEDGTANHCNWNTTDGKYSGVDVAEAMLSIAKRKGFISCDDSGFVNGVKDGSIIAGINGAWNSKLVNDVWGENFAAAKLPCYTLAGDSVQMCSFSGYKLLGVNAYSDNSDWAMKLAQHLSSEDTQLKRFEIIGECPSNQNAVSSPAVQASPVCVALFEQSQFADSQRIANTYWNPMYIFGITIAGGNPDNKDLQLLLDIMVDGITAIPEDISAD